MNTITVKDNDNKVLYTIDSFVNTIEYTFYLQNAWGVQITFPRSEITAPFNESANEILKTIQQTINNINHDRPHN